MESNGTEATEEKKIIIEIEFRVDQKFYYSEHNVENNARVSACLCGGLHLIETVACQATRRIILVLII